MYIAVTLLLLYEKNAVNLDKKAIEYLPADVPMIPNLTKVTVRQLLNHSSGIPDFVNSSFIEVFNDPYMNKSWKDYLNKYVSNQKSLFPPGKNHHYCNTNYLLLGLIIERVSGNQLGEAVQNFLLIPAGLSATFYKASPNYPKIPAVTDNYFSHYNDYLQNCTGIQQHFADIAMGYEGIIARPDDYLQFLHSLMNGNILQDSTFKIMTECSSSDESNVYGMGILKHGTIYGHSGRSIGTMTCLFHDTTNNTTFFYASNRGPYCETVMDTLFYSEMYNSLVSILSH